MATRDEVDAALKHSDLYKRAVPVEWKEIKALVPEEIHGGVLRVARAHDVKVSQVVFRALEYYFEKIKEEAHE